MDESRWKESKRDGSAEKKNAAEKELPGDFFDHEQAVVREKKTEGSSQQAERDWEAFLGMTESVEEDREEEENRRSLEQAWFERYRLAPLLSHREGGVELNALEEEIPPSLLLDSNSDHLQSILAASKKRKRQKQTSSAWTNKTAKTKLTKAEEASLFELDWRTGDMKSSY